MIFELSLITFKACILASVYPFLLILKDKNYRIAILIIFLFLALLLKSRTLFLTVFILSVNSEVNILHKIKKIYLTIASILALFILIFINLNSILGRIFIWRNIIFNLPKVPFFGFGSNTFKFHYSKWQLEYFLSNQKWSNFHLIADSPSFAFNEYFHFYIEYGFIAIFVILFLFYINLIFLKRKDSHVFKPFIQSNLCIFAFALVSYPLHSIWICIIIFVNVISILSIYFNRISCGLFLISMFIICVVKSFIKYDEAKNIWFYAKTLPINAKNEKMYLYSSVFNNLNNNKYFLYDYCSYLLNEENGFNLLDILYNNKYHFDQYEYYILLGKHNLLIGRLNLAQEYFTIAHFVMPNRFIPLANLLAIAKNTQNIMNIKKYANLIISTPTKVESQLVSKIKLDAEFILKNNN